VMTGKMPVIYKEIQMNMRRKGFTLVELMVVVAIIAVLVGLLMPAVLRARESARENKARTEIYELQRAWTIYYQHYGKLPGYSEMNAKATADLGGGNSDGIVFMEFADDELKKGFLDPWKQPYHLDFQIGDDVVTKWSFQSRVQCKNSARGVY